VIAVSHFGYLVAGYSITFGAIGGYVAWLGIRRRSLARALGGAGAPDPPSGSTR
jgi:CcmD family protein